MLLKSFAYPALSLMQHKQYKSIILEIWTCLPCLWIIRHDMITLRSINSFRNSQRCSQLDLFTNYTIGRYNEEARGRARGLFKPLICESSIYTARHYTVLSCQFLIIVICGHGFGYQHCCAHWCWCFTINKSWFHLLVFGFWS